MVDSDEDYSPDSDVADDDAVVIDDQHHQEPTRRKSPKRSAATVPQVHRAQSVRFPTNLRSIVGMKKHIVKLLKGQDVDANLSVRVLAVGLGMQEDYLLAKKKKEKKNSSGVPAPRIRETLCKQFHISNTTATNIIREYLINKRIYVTGKFEIGRSGNLSSKDSRIPRTEGLLVAVRNFVRSHRLRRERVTCRQVLDFMVENKHVTVAVDESGQFEAKAFNAAYRAVQRWVKEFAGYKQGRRVGNLVPTKENIAKKHFYLRRLFDNRSLPPGERKREVYTDESYIHEHYNRNDDSIWDPNDEQDVMTSKAKHKGRRYCFVAAIQGPNPTTPDSGAVGDMAGLVPGSVWAFSPRNTQGHQGDYHKVFNGDNYLQWWTNKLLSNLTQPSIIILDNAKYHCSLGKQVPKWSSMKKNEAREFLEQKGVAFDPGMSAVEMKQLVRTWIAQNEKAEIIRQAEKSGHEVLFTPPYHSDLQPIELVWASVKGRVGRQYSVDTTLSMVHERLTRAFGELEDEHDAVLGMIEKCAKTAKVFYDEITMEEEVDDDADSDGYSHDERLSDSDSDDEPCEQINSEELPDLEVAL
jgi:transposase